MDTGRKKLRMLFITFPTFIFNDLCCLILVFPDQNFFAIWLPTLDFLFIGSRLFFGFEFTRPNEFHRAARFCIRAGNRPRLVLL